MPSELSPNNQKDHSTATNSLIGYLTKKSLFSTSPTGKSTGKKGKSTLIKAKNKYQTSIQDSRVNKLDMNNLSKTDNYRNLNSANEMQSKSIISQIQLFQDDKNFQVKNHTVTTPRVSSAIQHQTGNNLSPSVKNEKETKDQNNRFGSKSFLNSINSPSPNQKKIQQKQQWSGKLQSQNQHQNQPQSKQSFYKPSFPKQSKNKMPISSTLTNQSNSHFESARVESAQYLDELSFKLRNEISSINHKISAFNSKMSQVLNIQFRNLREKIIKIVHDVFEQSEQEIRQYMKQQQTLLAKQMLQMKTTLQKEYAKVQQMKQQIKGPAWRKVAGELLSTELEKKIQESLKVSKSIEISQWQLGDLAQGKIQKLQKNLRDMVCLVK